MSTRAIVIPSVGRPSLPRLLEALEGEEVHVVQGLAPAAARNAGWRAVTAEWVVFLDDDVVPEPGWREALDRDLRPGLDGSQGRIVVPVPDRPTDWERNVAGLQDARWATADMAYRREALAAVGGFDERFPRAFREDADIALRMLDAGLRLERGTRRVVHPVGAAGPAVSLRKQAGNADDVLMRALHGRDWRERAGAPPGRRPRHLAIAAAGAAALGAAIARRPRAAALAGAAWAAGTAELAWARIAPGPRTPREVMTMAWTSAALPFAACAWWLRGLAGLRGALAAPGPRPWPKAVLLDRDGTLIEDVPYNGDAGLVEPMPGAADALARLREAGIPTAVVSNQSGIARGLVRHRDVQAIHRRMEELLGPLGPLEYCPHGPSDGCECRKPAPGLILRAAERLGVGPEDCAVIGDIGADVDAACAAGARAVLVPTARTRAGEVAAAPEVAPDLAAAVAQLLEDPVAVLEAA
ncbi:HAD-IIIA family hydrolase [Candidatus Solirubrobacter pratensis]|uniref:HAD-IIIA family hydrolase n=1 Tax=Candidatus Solirubrobacter pratensis TaxID=1298857 RepID=UPI00041F4711|nr:HAD-IIIA family hydrolase [Candidatus Solirubrobacter pratensis]